MTLNGGEQSTSFPHCFTPCKEPQYALNRRLGGARADVDILEIRNISFLLFKPLTVQYVS